MNGSMQGTDVSSGSGPVLITPGDLDDPRVAALLTHHQTMAREVTPPGRSHALDLSGLRSPGIRLWAAWDGDALLGVAALKRLSPEDGEVKSMHTAAAARRRGVGAALLRRIVDAGRADGLRRLLLETGSFEYFRPARELYRAHGFVERSPYPPYRLDPNSTYMELDLEPRPTSGDRLPSA